MLLRAIYPEKNGIDSLVVYSAAAFILIAS